MSDDKIIKAYKNQDLHIYQIMNIKNIQQKKIINALNEFNYANVGSNIYTVLNYDKIIIKLN